MGKSTSQNVKHIIHKALLLLVMLINIHISLAGLKNTGTQSTHDCLECTSILSEKENQCPVCELQGCPGRPNCLKPNPPPKKQGKIQGNQTAVKHLTHQVNDLK
ncbi:hypothetical protein PGT21_029092 [Puccinia graminis f. sp. tritici]|uniref:Uncharacterized protein n=1 Tax=Puccinia graminis f. sp. tritici TaxID=56615 RepID=A0A5B0MW90_PUCGR|nr:hypothetical protein PGT21_029092 [Puccinia graminis f. sp. tritici]